MSNNDLIKELAKKSNGNTWNLLTAKSRSDDQNLEMLEQAFTSLSLWKLVGTDLNLARGQWLVSRAACVAGEASLAFKYAKECAKYTEKAGSQAKDFDHFYAVEALARANAALGNNETAMELKAKAQVLAEAVEGEQTRGIALGDIQDGPWFNL